MSETDWKHEYEKLRTLCESLTGSLWPQNETTEKLREILDDTTPVPAEQPEPVEQECEQWARLAWLFACEKVAEGVDIGAAYTFIEVVERVRELTKSLPGTTPVPAERIDTGEPMGDQGEDAPLGTLAFDFETAYYSVKKQRDTLQAELSETKETLARWEDAAINQGLQLDKLKRLGRKFLNVLAAQSRPIGAPSDARHQFDACLKQLEGET